MEKLISDFSFGLFIWQTIIFVGLIFLLKKFAWKPILDAVNEREEGINKEIPLDKKVYDKVTGLYDVGDNNFYEFIKNDDLLFMKQNGLLKRSLKYMGNNTFESGIGFPKVTFELQSDGSVKVVIVNETKTLNGIKYLKYK